MGLRINANTAALGAQRATGRATNSLIRGLAQMGSGLRVGRAADDAAGLAISERFRAEIRQANTEIGNLQTAYNAAQTAEGGLGVQQDALQRVRELATQAANGTLTDDQRAALNQEAQQLLEGIDQTAETTEFNGTALLTGEAANVPVGTENQDLTLNVNESTTGALGLNGLDIGTQQGAADALGQVDAALAQVNVNRAGLGAQQAGFESAINQREIAAQNATESESLIRDLDLARATTEQTRNQLLLEGGIAALTQANLQGQTAARLLGG